jgi:hypothetical protein
MDIQEYHKLQNQYELEHECCPKCKAVEYAITLYWHPYVIREYSEHKDLNECICIQCSNIHKIHNRVPKQK